MDEGFSRSGAEAYLGNVVKVAIGILQIYSRSMRVTRVQGARTHQECYYNIFTCKLL